MRPLPLPVRCGNRFDLLRKFTNLTDGDFVLFVAMLLDAFRSGKHPILNLVGESGAAKTTLANLFKQLVDPDETETRNLPGTVRELFIAAKSARVRAWDNVSKIAPAISDALCRLSDGSGFATRKLLTDDEEFSFQGSRTIILTGVDNVVTRSDLSSRVVLLKLQPIKDEVRKSEKEFWAEFEQVRPLIFGALLDALAHGLKQLPTVRLDSMLRMADFELFGHACEGAYAAAGSFAAAWAANATELNEALIEEDCVAKACVAFMDNRTECTKTAATWLAELTNHDRTEQKVSQQRDWPKDATRFSRHLRLVAPTLRKEGIEVTWGTTPDRKKTRIITLRNVGRSDAAGAADADTGKRKRKAVSKKASKKRQRPQRPQRPSVRNLKKR
jgi:energy-coupling factor transporter ATP-binding protein EcfA2